MEHIPKLSISFEDSSLDNNPTGNRVFLRSNLFNKTMRKELVNEFEYEKLISKLASGYFMQEGVPNRTRHTIFSMSYSKPFPPRANITIFPSKDGGFIRAIETDNFDFVRKTKSLTSYILMVNNFDYL